MARASCATPGDAGSVPGLHLEMYTWEAMWFRDQVQVLHVCICLDYLPNLGKDVLFLMNEDFELSVIIQMLRIFLVYNTLLN